MSKLSADEKFLDVSDYGRPLAKVFANSLKETATTPVQVTLLFGLTGIIAVYCILKGYYVTAGIFLVLKSVIDAADGELARLKKTPSFTGRYLDSIFDILLNFILFSSIWLVTSHSIWITFAAFVSLQLQGTLYNYYYVILRHQSSGGDKTSMIFETKTPKAFPGEDQKIVNRLFNIYTVFYSIYDRIIYRFDRKAPYVESFPRWFMTFVSIYGLGFQLLLISLMLATGLIELIIPFFIGYSIFIFIFIAIRKLFLNTEVKEKQKLF